MTESIADWMSGQVIDLRGRKKVLRAAGVLSKSGDAARQLGNLSRYLQREHGFRSGDFLEATYRGRLRGDEWEPAPYHSTDCEAPLDESSALATRLLRWYDARLPVDQELHLVGYSLGGVVLFRALVDLLRENPSRWRLRVGSLSTIASPHFGSDIGVEGELLGLFGLGALLPAGAVGQELIRLGSDPLHRARVERDAELIRRSGIELLTLADEFDTVVTPDDAVIAPPGERDIYILASSRAQLGGSYEGAVLGHGPLLDNPKAWRMIADVIGPQEPSLRTSSGAIPL